MKKTEIIILALLLLLLSAFSSKAEEIKLTEHSIPDTNMKISLPNNFFMITRKMDRKDSLFDIMNIDFEQAQSMLEDNDRYLDAFDEDFTYELLLSIKDSTLSDFSSLSDFWINMFIPNIQDSYSKLGIDIYAYELYPYSGEKYIKLQYKSENASYLEYITVKNGKEIDVIIITNHTKVTNEDNQLGNRIINSIKYGDTITEYYIKKLGVSLSLSNDYGIEINKKGMEPIEGSQMVYFQAENVVTGLLFNVSLANVNESFPISFDNIDTDTANYLLPLFQAAYELNGSTVSSKKIVEYSGIKYLVYYIDIPITSKYKQIAYVTIIDGKEIVFYFYPDNYTNPVSEEMENTINSIMSTVQYNKTISKNDYNQIAYFHGDFSIMNGIEFGMSKEKVKDIEKNNNQSDEPLEWKAKGKIKHDTLSFYACKEKLFETESRDYCFDENGKLIHICFCLGIDESKSDILNKENYNNAFIKLKSLYGQPCYKDDGNFFPLFSDRLDNWRDSINCMQEYAQWILKYDSYYVLAEVFLVKTTLTGHYDCFATFTFFPEQEAAPYIGKSICLY